MASKDKKYKNLKLNLDDIVGIIQAWGVNSEYKNVSVEEPKDMSAQTLNYIVNCDGKMATIAIFSAKGGVYTISPNFGKEKELSTCIADYIANNSGKLSDSNPYKNGLSLNMTRKEFEAFFELLSEEKDVDVVEKNQVDEKKFFAKLINKQYGDSIVISYYSTGKLVIQGKPLELFCLAVEIVSEGQGLNRVVNAQVKNIGLKVNGDEIINEMKDTLGKAYDFLGTSHKAILANAYIFFRTDYVFSGKDIQIDYSVLFHPAARVLEGYILKQLVYNNILHENGEMLGYYFRGEEDNEPLTLYPQYSSLIGNETIIKEINRLYKTFHKLRHAYSHASERDLSTPIISNRDIADRNFNEIIEVISRSYEIIEFEKGKEK